MNLTELLDHLPDDVACEYLIDALFLSGEECNSKVEQFKIPTPLNGWLIVTRTEVENELARRSQPNSEQIGFKLRIKRPPPFS